ncbi:MAG TPA: cation-translocating P-type ATPase [Syntrophorhabdaceae bacterium]|nr:cation-translocating P-type ATPase [Syntrophorhabdaceae bacterium]
MEKKTFHCMHINQAAEELETNLEHGLTTEEAAKRLKIYGHNELKERPKPGFLKMLLNQFNNFLVIILIIAALVSLLLGEITDAIAIMVIVLLNSIVGVVQESKAEAALAALKKMATPNVYVIRNGHQISIPSSELVPGDICVIEAGNYVPADLRLIESVNLKIEEASLTGESIPVEKEANIILDKDITLGDRKNSAFMGTVVTYGRGKGIVTATGMKTQIGMIAEMLQSYEEEQTPLQKKLAELAKFLGIGCLIICAIVFIYGLIRDTNFGIIFKEGFLAYLAHEKKDIINLFMTAVSLAIAAIPEGLPAVVTICLALGMQKMIKRHALIRKLPAVETLGCATVICSDKTGTLTQNEMTVVQGFSGGLRFKVTGEGYSPTGQFFVNGEEIDPNKYKGLSLLLYGALLCNDAKLEENENKGDGKAFRMIGDPTEGAMVVAGEKAGLKKTEMEKKLPRVMEIPFDSDRKRMTTIHEIKDSLFIDSPYIAFIKGAPDVILNLSDRIVYNDEIVPMSEEKRNEILEMNHEMASQALRVLAVAFKPLNELPVTCEIEDIEKEFVFVGLLGMIDPPRPEVKEAIKLAVGAGVKSIMITGDYKDTAEAVAREIGLLRPNGKVLTGKELDTMPQETLVSIIDDVDVCCRVSPKHKTNIVYALKEKGHIVAMTGDGVNDAPALKRANIGVAMGITGTDVAKETADMVLTDDNYASIVSAIEEGRTIYANIRKFVYFLLVCNVGEILIVFFSMLFGMPLPFTPIMLLWLNLVTDGAPALALGLEKAEPDIMKRPPRPVKEPVINKDMIIGLSVIPIIDAIAVLSVFAISLRIQPDNLSYAQTMAFVTICFSELLRAYTARSEHLSIFKIGVFSNKWMQWAVLSSIFFVLITVYVPFLRPFFDTVPLTINDWLIILPFIFMAPVGAEMVKFFLRRRNK